MHSYVSRRSYTYVVLPRESIFGGYFALEPSVLAKRQIFGEKWFFTKKLKKTIFFKYMHDRCLYPCFLTTGIDFWVKKHRYRHLSCIYLEKKVFFKFLVKNICLPKIFFLPKRKVLAQNNPQKSIPGVKQHRYSCV